MPDRSTDDAKRSTMGSSKLDRVKYSARRIPFFLLQVLKRVGIRVIPLLTVREDFSMAGLDTGRFRMGFEDPQRLDEILRVEPGSDREELVRWFEKGNLCYGVRDEGRLIAKMWCDLGSFHFPIEQRTLKPGEAYLYAACVLPEYRGRDIAVLMRASCRDALVSKGVTRCYSTTHYYNHAARRFKEKLGCRNESLLLHIGLFGLWAHTWTLKRYA